MVKIAQGFDLTCLMRSVRIAVAVSLLVALFPLRAAAAVEDEEQDDDAEVVSVKGHAATITLNSFLSQVTEKHDDYQSAKKSFESSLLTGQESHLALFPSLFGNAQFTDDQKPNILFNYEKLDTTLYQFGISELTSFGLQGRFYYTLTNTKYGGLQFGGPSPVNISGLQGGATLELTFSLWRNWLGKETNLLVDQGDALAAANKHSQTFQMKSIMVAAESSYWKLYLARETVRVAEEALERAKKLYKFYEKRANLGLSNEADFYQADAALQARKVDLRGAADLEIAASREFNLARGLNSNSVDEDLASLTTEQIEALDVPKRNDDRDDVLAAAEQVKVTQASAELSRQKYLPTLEAYNTLATNTTNPSDYTVANSFGTNRPTASIGIRLNTSLDFGLVDEVRRGWEVKKQSAEFSYKRKRFEQDSSWNDLTDKFGQAKYRLVLNDRVIKSQKRKLEYERRRRSKGLTTTQQVINFELEYQQAELARIQTESELLQLLAQMKLFGDNYELR